MKREDLKKLELSDEAVDAIMKLHGQDVEAHKGQLEAKQAEIDGAKAQLTEASKTIDGLKSLDVEGVKKAAADWEQKAKDFEAQAKKASEEADAKVAGLKFDYALDTALGEAKAKNSKAVRALLNTGDLKLADDGSIVGLKEQLEKVKTDNDFLFSDEKPAPKFTQGGNNQTITSDAFLASALKGAGLEPKN